MSEASLDIVAIGCGGFFRRYHLPAIDADPGARIVAIFDPSPVPAVEALAAREGIAICTSLDDLPRSGPATAAIVTTPHTLHAAHVRFALARGWHVLCDKPFVMRSQEAVALARMASESDLVNAVALTRRYDPGCLRARDLIAAGAIGPVRYVESLQLGYESAGWFVDPALGGGGPYTGRASHIADLIPWLLGEAPTRLRSRLRGDGGARTDRGGFIELQFGTLECHLTCIEEGWKTWDEVRIFGESGLIELRRPRDLPIGWGLALLTGNGKTVEQLAADATPGDATRNMLAAVRGTTRVGCSFDDALTSVQVVEAAFLSARTGGDWVALGDRAEADR